MNVQVIAGPDGTTVWTSGALPGRTHDLTAARLRSILRELDRAGITTLATRVIKAPRRASSSPPYKGRDKPRVLQAGQPLSCQVPRTRRMRECPAEVMEATAQAPLQPGKVGHLVKVIVVLQNYQATFR